MSDDEDADTFVTIGTPFQPLEEDERGEEVKLVYARQRKPGETYQERRERQRFHGAFTGGFSAGYFNTVGSKAGWTPSSFSSSRRHKADLMTQQPEDYMDDEDLGRYGIAPRRITATHEFQVDHQGEADELGRVLGKRQHTGKEREASVLSDLFGDSFLRDIVRPARTSIGSALLKCMGWKEGQGVGSKRARKMEKGPRSYSCLLHPSVAATKGGPSGGGTAVLLAPLDVRPWLAEAKDDRHGIGYSGIQEDRVGEMKGKARSTGVHGLFGQAFGVGALEEEDDDIYSSERMTDYHSSALAEEEGEEKFGWTGPHATEAWSLSTAFSLLKRTLHLQKAYPPPALPKDFKPVHKATTETGANPQQHPSYPQQHPSYPQQHPSYPQQHPSYPQRHSSYPQQHSSYPQQHPSYPQRHPSYSLNATDRAQLTGEKVSVFSMLKSEDRERLQRGNATGERAREKRPNRWDKAPPPGARTTEELRAHGSTQLHGVTEWQREESSRQVFPTHPTLGGSSFASKFTTAGQIDTGQEPSSKSTSVDKVGQLSREVCPWYPHRVLCRRFDIPDPYPSSGVVGVLKAEKKPSEVDTFVSRAKSLAFSAPSAASDVARQSGSHGDGVQERLAAGGGLWRMRDDGTREEQQESNRAKPTAVEAEPPLSKEEAKALPQTEAEKRPPLDIFKAIFAESSASESDSDSGEDHKEEGVGTDSVGTPQDPTAAATEKDTKLASSDAAVRRADSGGSGQDQVEAGMEVCSRDHPQASQERTTAAVSFGPALPPSFDAGHSDASSGDEGVDRPVKLKEKHKKKRKKESSHRRHKHKDKHKHRKDKTQ